MAVFSKTKLISRGFILAWGLCVYALCGGADHQAFSAQSVDGPQLHAGFESGSINGAQITKDQIGRPIIAHDLPPMVPLFERADTPFSPTTLQELWETFLTGLAAFDVFDAWRSIAIIVVGVVLIMAVSHPVTRHLNRFVTNFPSIQMLSPFTRAGMTSIAIAAFFVFLLRFGIINFTHYPVLENMVHVLTSICLSTIMFLALGKIHFISAEQNKDALGERRQNYSWLWNGLKRLSRLILLVMPIAAVAGYIHFAQYVSFNILITIAAALLFFTLRDAVVRLNQKLRPIETEDTLSPLTITIVEPIIALVCGLLALFFWGMTSEDIASFVESYSRGLTIGKITIDFSAISAAIGLFFAFYYFTKLVQWFLSSRVFPYTKLDGGIRDAVITIAGYVGIIIAALVAMSTLGLDMSNLAIVAGALSVGIGFGLQAIFNNFVSGLILLFERPVKVGDWVIVGDQQGTIKKIRVRSTEIETFWNSSVIVPNSQLISETVTNWTLHDRVGRVDVSVGVAYGSDTQKVKEVLLQVVKEHPQVRTTPEARVFFMNFGESSLDFELRCFIRNIRDVFAVSSDLRFAIDKAFRDHNIQIPFPQRDVRIVSNVSVETPHE